jgi:cation diffusion facilitator family transporter
VNQSKQEASALKLSAWGALGMAILGIIFGMITPSDAILLDGFFSLINFVMAGATLWVSWLLQQPEDDYFQFGYDNFEPLVNLIKGFVITILSLFALLEAINALLNGGRPINTGLAVIYAIIAAGGCLIIALFQINIAKKTNSPLVRVDAKNWLIDGILSLTLGLAFGIVVFIKNTHAEWFLDYIDPTIVIVLVLITISIPIKIIISNLKIFLFAAPNSEQRKRIKQLFTEAIIEIKYERYWLRMTQLGRNFYLHIYFKISPDNPLNNIINQDQLRETIAKNIEAEYPNLLIDIVFTQNEYWAIQD